MINTHLHDPREAIISGIKRGAITDPTLAPPLKRPVASALSFFGNHSAIVFILAGKFPASLNPSPSRAKANPNQLRAAAWNMLAILHNPTASAKPQRVPILSITYPTNRVPAA